MRTKHRFAVLFCAAFSLGATALAPSVAASGAAVGPLVADPGSTAQVAQPMERA